VSFTGHPDAAFLAQASFAAGPIGELATVPPAPPVPLPSSSLDPHPKKSAHKQIAIARAIIAERIEELRRFAQFRLGRSGLA
jgi:hypothetical protein